MTYTQFFNGDYKKSFKNEIILELVDLLKEEITRARTVKTLVRLCGCTGSPEYSLCADVSTPPPTPHPTLAKRDSLRIFSQRSGSG